MDGINIKHLSYQYPFTTHPCLNNISLSVERGTILQITGNNASGKSTLLHLIRGFLSGYQGNITINGQCLNKYSERELIQTVGCLLQNPFTQFCQTTVYEEVAFPLENLGLPIAEIHSKTKQALDLLDISYLQDKDPAFLSGGQLQLVALAALLVLEPDILLLDDPCSQLDPKTSSKIHSVIKDLQSQNKIILITGHSLFPEYDTVILNQDGFHPHHEEIITVPSVSNSFLPKSEEPIIEMNDVSVTYEKEKILEHISLTIGKNTHTAILGTNGSGKSTFLKLINGLLKPDTGSVIINNYNTETYTPAFLSRYVGSVFQNPDTWICHKTVLDEISFNLETDQYLNEAIALTGLEKLLKKNPYDLTFSQRKWINIASILARNPDIFLFDEPTSCQDKHNIHKFAILLQNLTSKEKTTLTVTHNTAFVKEFIPNTLIIQNKNIVY